MNYQKLFERGLEMHHITNTAYPLTPISLLHYKIRSQESIQDLLKKEFDKYEELSLYVHIPFCQSRCRFCEYTVVSGDDNSLKDKYVDYLLKEIAMYKKYIGNKKIIGFDMGGGTPTQLSGSQIKKITDYLKENFNFDPKTEMSIETTPLIAAKNPEKIRELYEIGYRRISMGIQTINPKLLMEFEREGSINLYQEAIDNIRTSQFKKLNIDLMYGFLNQSKEDFIATLEFAIRVNPEYITLYRNRYKGTKIAFEAENVSLDKVNEQYEIAFKILNSHGYIANYGKNTFSKIESDYGTSDYLTSRVIKGTPYVGFGLGAQSFGHSYLAYNEGAKTKSLSNYFEKIDASEFPIQDIYALPISESIAKMVSVAFYFGFVNFEYFKERFQIDFENYFAQELKFLKEKEFITMTNTQMIITKKGVNHMGGIIPMFYSKESQEELFQIKKIF